MSEKTRQMWEQHAGRIVVALGFGGVMTLAGLVWKGGQMYERLSTHDDAIREQRETNRTQAQLNQHFGEMVAEMRGQQRMTRAQARPAPGDAN